MKGRKRGFSKKQLKNRRFQRTEEAILKAYFGMSLDEKTPRGVARRAGISRATIHRHHGTIFAIKSNYEKYLLHEYKILMRKEKYDLASTERVFLVTLVFVMMHKKVFMPILEDGAEGMVREMMEILKPRIWKGCKETEKFFEIYVGEVYALLWQWGRTGMAEAELKTILDNLMYLTKTAEQRLGCLK